MRRIFFSSLLFMSLALMGSVFFMQGCSEKNKSAEAAGTEKGATSSAIKAAESAQAEITVPLAPKANVDIVYYFMTTQRCTSCMKIEAYTKEAIEKGLAESLKKRDLVWRMVNVDESGNAHFIKDYQLFTKSVVLVKIRDGKQVNWKNLDKVWPLLGDQNQFVAYIINEVKSFTEKG
jgi:hypothetical protein